MSNNKRSNTNDEDDGGCFIASARAQAFLHAQASTAPGGNTGGSLLDRIDLPTFAKKHSTKMSFPEKLMLLLMHIEKVHSQNGKTMHQVPAGWTEDGQVMFISDKDELVARWLPVFFRKTKFSSFIRKLYRWGFRQVSIASEANAAKKQAKATKTGILYFYNENFQQNNKGLLSNMRSVEGRRTEQEILHWTPGQGTIADMMNTKSTSNSDRSSPQSDQAGSEQAACISSSGSENGLVSDNSRQQNSGFNGFVPVAAAAASLSSLAQAQPQQAPATNEFLPVKQSPIVEAASAPIAPRPVQLSDLLAQLQQQQQRPTQPQQQMYQSAFSAPSPRAQAARISPKFGYLQGSTQPQIDLLQLLPAQLRQANQFVQQQQQQNQQQQQQQSVSAAQLFQLLQAQQQQQHKQQHQQPQQQQPVAQPTQMQLQVSQVLTQAPVVTSAPAPVNNTNAASSLPDQLRQTANLCEMLLQQHEQQQRDSETLKLLIQAFQNGSANASTSGSS